MSSSRSLLRSEAASHAELTAPQVQRAVRRRTGSGSRPRADHPARAHQARHARCVLLLSGYKLCIPDRRPACLAPVRRGVYIGELDRASTFLRSPSELHNLTRLLSTGAHLRGQEGGQPRPRPHVRERVRRWQAAEARHERALSGSQNEAKSLSQALRTVAIEYRRSATIRDFARPPCAQVSHAKETIPLQNLLPLALFRLPFTVCEEAIKKLKYRCPG